MRTERYIVPMRSFDAGVVGDGARFGVAILILIGLAVSGYAMLGLIIAGVMGSVMSVGFLMDAVRDWWQALGMVVMATWRLLLGLAFLGGSVGFLVLLARQ